MRHCDHEVEPYPPSPVYDDSPLPRTPPGLERIVACKKCGAPIDRGPFGPLIHNPNAAMPWFGEDDDE